MLPPDRSDVTLCCISVKAGRGAHERLFSLLQVKSYLTGNPAIAIALNDSLVIGRREGGQNDYGGYGRCAASPVLGDKDMMLQPGAGTGIAYESPIFFGHVQPLADCNMPGGRTMSKPEAKPKRTTMQSFQQQQH